MITKFQWHINLFSFQEDNLLNRNLSKAWYSSKQMTLNLQSENLILFHIREW